MVRMCCTRSRRQGFTFTEILIALAVLGLLVALALPAIQKVRESANTARCANNLKQIGLSLHNYHNSEGALPMANSPSPANASAFTRLLPYLDDANLERGYDYSQSPLAPANLTITYRVMKLFRSPSMNSPAHASGAIDQQRGWSSYAFCIGDNDAWGPGPDTGAIVRSGVMPNSPIRLSEIASADGCSTTLAAGEMGFQLDDYLFTSGPNSGKIRGGNTWWAFGYASYSFGSTNMGFNTTEGTAADLLLRLQTFRSDRSLGANFLFVDGSVRLLRPSLPLADYRALGTRNGSESVSLVGAER